ncbi:MAG: zf-HC2 domain-containing protein [Armatimonadetes bacterium]|nr:zf-HC2 domain-containing protein [Armatimonadota bacterium]
MKCKHVMELVDAYGDGEVSDTNQGRIEAHLEQCDACRHEVARVLHWIDACRQPVVAPGPDLKRRVHASTVGRPPQETRNMNKKLGIRFGLTAAALAAVACVAFVPRIASASSAKELWGKMAEAAKRPQAVHIVNVWYEPDGSKGQTQVWTDGKSIRINEADGTVRLAKGGKVYATKPGPQESDEIFVAMPTTLDAAIFTVPVQIKMLGAGASEPMDLGVQRVDGADLHRVAVLGRSGNERFTFWVDTKTNLPVRKTNEERKGNSWVETGYQTFEFTPQLEPELFEIEAKVVSSPSQGSAKSAVGGG